MSAARRFFSMPDDPSVFKFTIDTTKVVAGATDGSENPLTFRIPCLYYTSGTAPSNNCIIRVSDGRPDKAINNFSVASDFLLSFATAGIYTISIIGSLAQWRVEMAAWGYDKLKITEINQWGYGTRFSGGGNFSGCSNLIIKATNTLVLPANSSDFFRGIKGFETSLELFDTSKVTTALRILAGVITPLTGQFNSFWLSIGYLESVYSSITFLPNVTRIEIESNTLEELFRPWDNVVFQNTGPIEIICRTPNLKTLTQILRNGQVASRCHMGKVDVRNVTNATTWRTSGITTAQIDATLLGWSTLPYMQPGVEFPFPVGSKYSNNPAVIAAYNKLTINWGVKLTNLTMA